MSTDLEEFERFFRDRLAAGEVNALPEEVLRQWRANGGHLAETPKSAKPVESLFDRLNRKGLLSTIEGGPPDLSTNPQHMEGFGER
jgi:hypothetical protein